MRRFIAGLTLLAGLAALLVLPLTSTGQPPNLAEELRTTVNKTLGGVNDVVARLREEERKRREREAARRRAAAAEPRAATPDANGQGYNPPLHGSNPHGQGSPTTLELPPSTGRPMPPDTNGSENEILVVGRTRGEQNANGTYHGQISTAALLGNDVLPVVDSNPGETQTFAPLQGILDPLCNATQQGICLTVLQATSTTTGTGSTNTFSVATADLGGPTGISADAVRSNGNISQDTQCQNARGDSAVADAAIGAFTADAVQSTSDSRQCKDGSQTQTNTSNVVNLGAVGLQVPPIVPAGCANGTPNTPALLPLLLPAVCNANESNAAQAASPYGVREGLTTFALDVGTQALLKATTGASESRASIRAQCSDGVDNDGDGKIDFPADPDCTGPTDDSEAGNAGRPECSDGVDNDGDGKIDFPADPGCTSRNDNSEGSDGGNEGADRRGDAECEDGRDNDGDGLVDFPNDPGCTSRNDDSEAGGGGTAGAGAGGGTECSDGIDNDGDGKIDFPDDPGCESENDDSEGGDGGALAFTGTNLVLLFLIGSLVLLAGLGIRTLTGRRNGSRAERAGMA